MAHIEQQRGKYPRIADVFGENIVAGSIRAYCALGIDLDRPGEVVKCDSSLPAMSDQFLLRWRGRAVRNAR